MRSDNLSGFLHFHNSSINQESSAQGSPTRRDRKGEVEVERERVRKISIDNSDIGYHLDLGGGRFDPRRVGEWERECKGGTRLLDQFLKGDLKSRGRGGNYGRFGDTGESRLNQI